MRVTLMTLIVAITAGALCGVPPALAQLEDAPTAQDHAGALAAFGDAFAARLEFNEQVGLTPQDALVILRAKAEKHRLQEALRIAAAELSAALQTPEAEDEFVQEALGKYLALRDATTARMAEMDTEVVEQTGAADDPKKMGALVLMGAVDNGLRMLCAVRNGVIGSAPGALEGNLHAALTPLERRRAIWSVLMERQRR